MGGGQQFFPCTKKIGGSEGYKVHYKYFCSLWGLQSPVNCNVLSTLPLSPQEACNTSLKTGTVSQAPRVISDPEWALDENVLKLMNNGRGFHLPRKFSPCVGRELKEDHFFTCLPQPFNCLTYKILKDVE